jgi:hypothetical protein
MGIFTVFLRITWLAFITSFLLIYLSNFLPNVLRPLPQSQTKSININFPGYLRCQSTKGEHTREYFVTFRVASLWWKSFVAKSNSSSNTIWTILELVIPFNIIVHHLDWQTRHHLPETCFWQSDTYSRGAYSKGGATITRVAQLARRRNWWQAAI